MSYQEINFLFKPPLENHNLGHNLLINDELNSEKTTQELNPRITLEMLLQIFEEYGALSVSTEDANLDTLDEAPLYAEPNLIDSLPEMASENLPWQEIKVTILFDDQANIPEILTAIKDEFEYAIDIYELKKIDEQNWVHLTQSQFPPILIGDQIAIVPSWHAQGEFANRRACLQLDPGLAFGTGSHPTTALCLNWLDEYFAKHAVQDNPLASEFRVLDYGCGSGILAMAAYKLGATEVIGVDIDEQAVQASEINFLNNQIPAKLYTTDMDISQYYQNCDLVLANILSNPLKLLAPLLPQFLKKEGYLLLSGILERQTNELIEYYAPYINLQVYQIKEEWVCLFGQKI
jgi:ribosomal protein L11 methyltransferase